MDIKNEELVFQYSSLLQKYFKASRISLTFYTLPSGTLRHLRFYKIKT